MQTYSADDSIGRFDAEVGNRQEVFINLKGENGREGCPSVVLSGVRLLAVPAPLVCCKTTRIE